MKAPVSATPRISDNQFLSGGGEMGHLTREFDWPKTPLGAIDSWPLSLKTTLGIMLHSAFPMFLFWGKELTCFYNDAYRPSLGNNGKHPAVGKGAREVWPDIWHFIGPLIEKVMTTGEPVWFEDQFLPIYRNGRMEDVYWTFSYSPAYDDHGKIIGTFVTCTETTSKVLAQKQLQEKRDQLHFALESAELGAWDYNPVSHKFSANSRLKEWFGLSSADETPPDFALSMIKESDRKRVTEATQAALKFESGGLYAIDYVIVHPVTGLERDVRAKGRAWFNEDKIPYRFNGTLQDITETKKSEKEKQNLVAIIEASHEFIGLANADTSAAYVNPAGRRMLGWDDWKGKHISDCIYPEDQPLAQNVLAELVEKGFVEQEIRFYNAKTGEPFWLQWNAFTINDPDTGILTGLATVSPNINERKKAELKLRESEERFRSLADQSPMIVYIVEPNAEATMSYFNKTWLDYTGQTFERALGRAWDGIVHPDDVHVVLDIYATAFKNREAYTLPPIRLRRHDGEYRWFLFKGTPRYLPNNEFMGFVGVGIDIHDQKLMEFALKASEETLEQLVRERTSQLERSNEDLQQFAHVASHDLKEPVRKIKTFVNRIIEEAADKLTAKEKGYIEKVQSAASRMSSMIDGVLLYSTVNAALQKIEVIDLKAVLNDIQNDLEILIHQKSASLNKATLPVIEGAAVLIYQLFYNLMNNSLKFSKPGRDPIISVTGEIINVADEEHVRIEFKDNGIGFSEDYANIIFNTFTRLNSKDKFEGTGLGLALCKKIVVRHQGTIEASGTDDEGAVFIITLPLKQKNLTI